MFPTRDDAAVEGAGRRRDRALGGPAGNEVLTSATAALLTILLVGEGVTILSIGGLLGPHMFIGLALIPPVGLKLASTGYRFTRYYSGARSYREKGPPLLPLRLLAPVLIVATIGVLVTGVLLMTAGHRSDELLFLHKLCFYVWAAVFAVHFLSYLPRVLTSLRSDWGAAGRHRVPGTGPRAMLLAVALGGGLALALALLPTIRAWHREPRHRVEGASAPSGMAALPAAAALGARGSPRLSQK